jgi:hypothetical protein
MRKLIARPWRRTSHRTTATTRPLPGSWWQWLAAGIALALAVAGITGIISYEHGLDVAHATGNTGLVAILIPLVPDLDIAMSSLVLVVASAAGERRPFAAMAALVVGIGWTVAQNVAGGWHGGAGGALLAGGIPVAFVLTVELLLWLVRKLRRGEPAATPSHPQPPAPLTTEAALRVLLASDSQRRLSELLDVPRSRVQAWGRQVAEPVAEATPEAALNGSSHAAAGPAGGQS